MAKTLLYLTDDAGQAAPHAIQLAVTKAHKYIQFHFPRIEDTALAAMAEAVTKSICRKGADIHAPSQYALAAMIGQAQEWIRKHPGLEIKMTARDLEAAAGGIQDPCFVATEHALLFERMKNDLTPRDRQILMLIQRDLDSPVAVASALGLSYEAAKKALHRAKEKMSLLLHADRMVKEEGIERRDPLLKSCPLPNPNPAKVKT
jgi:DNA-directed RNA polymerase specialized sigma24 family protein